MSITASDAAFEVAKQRAKRIQDRYKTAELEGRLAEFQKQGADPSVLEEIGEDIAKLQAELRTVNGQISEREDELEVEANTPELDAEGKVIKTTVDQRKAKAKALQANDPGLKSLRGVADAKQLEVDTLKSRLESKRAELRALESQSLLVFAQLITLGA
jgi:hypothetical protein